MVVEKVFKFRIQVVTLLQNYQLPNSFQFYFGYVSRSQIGCEFRLGVHLAAKPPGIFGSFQMDATRSIHVNLKSKSYPRKTITQNHHPN